MPFTFAHPAAVLWLARGHRFGTPFSAFVIGSMSPDFEYFLRLRMLSVYSHSMLGIVTFCLPVGLLVYAIFRSLIAPGLWPNLPLYFRERLSKDPGNGGSWRHAVLVVGAIIFGAVTHVVWDGFTHGNGAFVLRWSGLESRILGVPMYKILQHGSTVAGLSALVLWFHFRKAEPPSGESKPVQGYWTALAVTFLVMLVAFQFIQPGLYLTSLVIHTIDACFLALLVAGCWTSLRNR